MSDEEKAKKSAVIVKTGEQVTVSNIVEKTDSGIIAELTNGKEVYISTGTGNTNTDTPAGVDAFRFNNDDMNKAVIYASNYDNPQTANVFLKAAATSPVKNMVDFSKAFNTVYLQGLRGKTLNTRNLNITKEQAKLAYISGQEDAKKTQDAGKGRVDGKNIESMANNSNYKNGVTRLDTAKKLAEEQSCQLAVLDAYGKKYGLSIITVDTYESGNTNASFVGKNNIILALDTEGDAYLAVAGHEVYHYLEKNNSEDAAKIRKGVIDYLKNSEKYDYAERFNEFANLYGTDNVDMIESEITANAMFDVLSERKTINELADEQPGLLKKIKKGLDWFIYRLQKCAASLKWKEQQVLKDDIEALSSIKQLFDMAMKNIDTSKNTAQTDGEVRYSRKGVKITPDMTEAERADVLKNTNITLAQYIGDKELTAKSVLMLKSSYNSQAGQILKSLGEKFGVFKKYSNDNIELEFNYSRSSLNESIHKQGDISTNFYDFAKMLYVFDEVVKNAVPIEVHTDKYVGTTRANPNLKYDYVLLSAFGDGEYITPVEFHIKEFNKNSKDQNKLYVSITLGKIKIENKIMVQVAENSNNENQWRNTPLFSKISIPQLVSKINPEYGNFYKYIPTQLLNKEQIRSKNLAVEDENYRLKVMRGEDVSDALSSKAKEKGYTSDSSWRMDHKAPNAKNDICITDIDRAYGGDGSIYSPNAVPYYGDGRAYDYKAINAIRKVRNSPETLISIYRAVPNNIKDSRIRNGDWVTIDRDYALHFVPVLTVLNS